MRIIAGTARSLPLKTLPGSDTRPTTDRIKETLFNILNPDIFGSRFLDLFAGSGQIGLEAVSRGAKLAVFVDNNKKACSIIEENINFTKFNEQCRVINTDALNSLRTLEGREEFDIIFLDPPYAADAEPEILMYLQSSKVLAPDGLIVIEASLDKDISYSVGMGYEIVREKTYKTNKHIFLRKKN